ncbi:MAG: hypothetical protein ACYS0I_14890 [Planctomycetota bacterium]|jgi:hypothetical protein
MKKKKNENWLDELIARAFNFQKPQFDPEKWKQQYPEEYQLIKSRSVQPPTKQRNSWTAVFQSPITKLAAAALLLIAVGYISALLTAPRQLNAQQIQALQASLKSSIEPAIRRQLLEQLNAQWQLALANSSLQLKDELNQQFQSDLNQYAVWTLAASNTVTNKLLTELIQSINDAQNQDRRWVAAALDQIELNRLRDKAQLANGLENLALYTDDELMQTKQDMARWISYGQPDTFVPEKSKAIKNSSERSKK